VVRCFWQFSDPRSSAFIRGKLWFSDHPMIRSPDLPIPPCFKGFRFLALATLLALAGCGKSEPTSQPGSQPGSAATPATISVDASTAGSISGTVSFKGAAPKLKPLDMTADAGCPATPQPSDVIVVSGGKLANVFVYVKEGLPQGTFAVPGDPAVLDQKGCRYRPHVMGVMAGQPLKILNSDTADHNVHDMPGKNPAWNEFQNPTDKPILKTFAKTEMMIPVQCNQHPWMRAYINVMSHPYFAVSGSDGRFEIKNLPPGEYTLTAVHEKFGEQTMQVKVGPKMDTDARFVFAAQ
jgi:plastocyanin/predicted small lipoprotein YifL